jgi:hypothetical protein
MEKYDYRQATIDDICAYIRENDIVVTKNNRKRLEDELYDKMFVCDSVTGNASGSYTFNAWKAEEYLCHNLDLLAEAIDELGGDAGTYKDCMEIAEKGDVTIRCYLLGECLSFVLDKLEEDAIELDDIEE